MLTPLNSRAEEDSDKTTGEYYYPSSQQQQQHYYCQIPFNYVYHPSLYETNQYYTPLTNYSQGQEENEMFYPLRPVDQQITPYSTPFSNTMFSSSLEQVHANTDYVSSRNYLIDCLDD